MTHTSWYAMHLVWTVILYIQCVCILCSLIDRRGFVTEEMEAHSSGVSYGATSAIESVSYNMYTKH